MVAVTIKYARQPNVDGASSSPILNSQCHNNEWAKSNLSNNETKNPTGARLRGRKMAQGTIIRHILLAAPPSKQILEAQ